MITSSAAGAALLAAAADAGCFGDGRRVLLVANEAQVPEVVPDPAAAPGFGTLATRFDEVIGYNELIAPLHPAHWRPNEPEVPVLGRLLAARVSSGEPIDELVVESFTVGAGRTVATLLPDVPLTVADHTLAVYGPPLRNARTDVVDRETRLLHPGLVPGPPTLMHLGSQETEVVPGFGTALAALAAAPVAGVPDAVVLGERYAERGMLGAPEERQLRLDAFAALHEAGRERIVFAPHPAASPADVAGLTDAAASAGTPVTLGAPGTPHEAWLAHEQTLLVGTTSPALLLAAHSATFGTRTIIDAPLDFQIADRVPLVLADAVLPRLRADGSLEAPEQRDVDELLAAVAFCVSPNLVPHLRSRAVAFASAHGTKPYLRRLRFEALGADLPSSSPAPRPPLARARAWVGRRLR